MSAESWTVHDDHRCSAIGAGMIHYHGLPITPSTAAAAAIGGGHAFVSFRHPDQIGIALHACQSFALDNGAFSAWKAGEAVTDWHPYYDWADGLLQHPACDFAIIPDVIDGSEAEQEALLREWPFGMRGVPVWHMHEPIGRLRELARVFPRVALGSSGEYAEVGSAAWWNRMAAAMNELCIDGLPPCKLHGLRMLDPDIFTRLPLSSADSTNIAQNIGIDSAWRGTYQPPSKESRAALMRQRIESHQAAPRWIDQPIQDHLCLQQQSLA